MVRQRARFARTEKRGLALHRRVLRASAQPVGQAARQRRADRQLALLVVAQPFDVHADDLGLATVSLRRAVEQVVGAQHAQFLGRQAQLEQQHQHRAVARAHQIGARGNVGNAGLPHRIREDRALGVFAGRALGGSDRVHGIDFYPAHQQRVVVDAVEHAPITPPRDVADLAALGGLRDMVDEMQHLHGAGFVPGHGGNVLPLGIEMGQQELAPCTPDEAIGLGRLCGQRRPGIAAARLQPVIEQAFGIRQGGGAGIGQGRGGHGGPGRWDWRLEQTRLLSQWNGRPGAPRQAAGVGCAQSPALRCTSSAPGSGFVARRKRRYWFLPHCLASYIAWSACSSSSSGNCASSG